MAVVRTSKVDLPGNGQRAYAYVAQPNDDAKQPGLKDKQTKGRVLFVTRPSVISYQVDLSANGSN